MSNFQEGVDKYHKVSFERRLDTIWIGHEGGQFVLKDNFWTLVVDDVQVFGVDENILRSGKPETCCVESHTEFHLKTSKFADGLENWLMDVGIKRVNTGECPECFGTGFKGGFQVACSRGCLA